MLERLASRCFHRRRIVLIAWILAMPLAYLIAGAAGGKFDTGNGGGGLPASDSARALQIVKKAFPQTTGQANGQSGEVVFEVPAAQGGVAAKKTEIDAFLSKLASKELKPGRTIVAHITSPFDGQRPYISQDGTVGVAGVDFTKGVNLQVDPRKLVGLAKGLRAQGVVTEFGGEAFYEFKLPPSEVFGLLAAIIILLVAFGSLIAMGLPILTAVFGVGIAIALVQLAAAVFTMPNFVTNLSGMIGLGVGIDYVLFIITRYRDELHAGKTPHDATVRALGTSGRAVVFAGLTVMISMLGMFLMGLSFVNGIAIAGATPVLVIVLASITLIPAMLGFIGHKIDGRRYRRQQRQPAHETGWHKWSRLVQRRAWPFAIGGFAVLALLAAPVFSMRLGFSDRGNDPKALTTRRAYDLKAKGFGAGSNGPLLIAVEAGAGEAQGTLDKLASAFKGDADVQFVSQPAISPDGAYAILPVLPKTGPQEKATFSLVHRLRDAVIPATLQGSSAKAYVGGWTAGGVDFADNIGTRLPLFIGAVLVLSFLLLMAVFRSILVPLKAVIMNLLSIGAAYGVVTWIFQDGHFGSLIGLGKPGPIEPWAPMMLFAIVFGLSMDYEVFLLSKIKEEYDTRKDNSVAVVEGLASTARLITAAAAIMVCVFLGFITGDRTIKLFGLGLATAVFLDATVVRILLVPATMELLGNRNWWFPKWLDRMIPDLDVEGHHAGGALPATDMVSA